MGGVGVFIQMGVCTTVSGKQGKGMDLAKRLTQMEKNTKEITMMAICTVMEFSLGKTEENMKGSLKTVKNQAKGRFIIPMVANTKVNLKMESSMAGGRCMLCK